MSQGRLPQLRSTTILARMAALLLAPAAAGMILTAFLPPRAEAATRRAPIRIEGLTQHEERNADATRAFLRAAAEKAAAMRQERSFAGRSFPKTILEPWTDTAENESSATDRDGDAAGAGRHDRSGARSNGAQANPASDWSPYAGPFGRGEAAHLLRRAMIGPRIEEINTATADGLDAALDGLLAPRPLPPPPGGWATDPMPDLEDWTPQMADSLVTLYLTRQDMLRLWWAEQMLGPDPGATEAMTLFWHDHFATGAEKVFIPSSLYFQNQLLREYALGNFKELVHAIALDPAMMIWLDSNYNFVGDVNENFARELLELFTIGIGTYTQNDVRAAARAFTGYYTPDGVNVYYINHLHDHGLKMFLGNTGDFDGDDIIDIIFQQPETAEFIVRKLYRYFLDESPDEALVTDLAATFRNSNYEIAPVVRRMFRSTRFFDPQILGCVYTDGTERGIGLLRSFQVGNIDYSDLNSPQSQWTFLSMWIFGQILLDPPNVGGWPGYRSWINSYTLPYRRILDIAVIDGELWDTELFMQADVMALATQVTDPNDPGSIVDDIAAISFGMPPTPTVRDRLLTELLGGMAYDEWAIDHPGAVEHLQAFFRLLVRMPDFQLK